MCASVCAACVRACGGHGAELVLPLTALDLCLMKGETLVILMVSASGHALATQEIVKYLFLKSLAG